MAQVSNAEVERRRALRKGLNDRTLRCCFCGGEQVAEQEDHVPARALFRDKQWPEGHSFASCGPCNAGVREEENILAYVVRATSSGSSSFSEVDRRDLKKYRDAMMNDEWRRLGGKASPVAASEYKDLAARLGIPADPQSMLNNPIMKFGPVGSQLLDAYFRKIGKALHFMHTGLIVPLDARIGVYCGTVIKALELPPELRQFLQTLQEQLPAAPVVKNGRSLADQFEYRAALSPDATGSIFICRFWQAMTLVILIELS